MERRSKQLRKWTWDKKCLEKLKFIGALKNTGKDKSLLETTNSNKKRIHWRIAIRFDISTRRRDKSAARGGEKSGHEL